MPHTFTPEQKQSALWLALGVLLAVLLVLLGPVLTPFIAAAILAYALNPGVDWLDRQRIGRFSLPRSVAVLLVIALLFAALLALILIVVPVLQSQLPLLREKIPAFLAQANDFLSPRLTALGIHVNLDVEGLKKLLSSKLASSSDQIWGTLLTSARQGSSAVLGWAAMLLLIPFILFYLLLDWHRLLHSAFKLLPRQWIDKTRALSDEVDGLLAQYLRGQLLVMLMLALYYSATLMLAGFDVALPVGIITGLLVFIPYLGFGLGLMLALIAAVLQFDGIHGLVLVAVIYGLGQVLESFFLTPRLVGERIGLHPLAVIFALMAFGQLFGFVGILLALPLSAIISVALKHLRTQYLQSSFYNQ
ncbi:AI-2E family transporter [Herminiimonas sp. CN]|uniref:AI-2E family transporter n=1 Tax=Herminiimonas sp. CN TaxID=1349818 RepID=UPI00047420D4|nr:AI-2E family transporter [Herminiimonas sp. CN]